MVVQQSAFAFEYFNVDLFVWILFLSIKKKKKSSLKYIITVNFSTFCLASGGLSEINIKWFSGIKSHC